jgi:hypothetical protein
MRVKLTLLAASALASAGAAVVMSAPTAHAINCPPGTIPKGVKVGTATAVVCVPGMECDPGPCDPTAAPPRD